MDLNPSLAELHDIHLPTKISLWPPASGYIALIGCILFMLVLALFINHYYQKKAPQREALDELKHLKQHHEPQLALRRLTLLLKQLSLLYYPRTHIAGLYGEDWIVFLENNTKKISFEPVKHLLTDLSYQRQPSSIPPDDMKHLFDLAEKWIKQLHRRPHV